MSRGGLQPCNFERRRDQRRVEALDRAMDRLGRSTDQQLRVLDRRPGNSARERARLIGRPR